MNFDDFRRRADRVREVPLETVLALRHAVRDPRDRQKWHTEQGPVSITGQKFTNWHQNTGGGGAIDLVMHLANLDASAAVAWLEQYSSAGPAAAATAAHPHHASGNRRTTPSVPPAKQTGKLRLPARNDSKLRRVQNYLTQHRNLSSLVLDSLIEAGKLYADNRGNAVFLMVAGKANQPVGAELRGTGTRVWRGMAPGSQKDSGYFWVGAKGPKRVVLCESAIDAISCYMLYPDRVCISTAGARPNPTWLPVILDHGYGVDCGFDADPPGDAAAQEMIRLYPDIQRLRPVAKDWNLLLSSPS
jgi:hypothetical protein